MKVTLKPNAEIETLTQGELESTLAAALSGFSRPPVTIRAVAVGATDGSGNANGDQFGIKVYRPKVGYTFRLHRLVVLPDGSTFGAPYTSMSGYLNIMRNESIEDGLPFTAPGLPAVWTAGTADGILFNNADQLRVDIFTGPTSKSVSVRIQGTLETTPGQLDVI